MKNLFVWLIIAQLVHITTYSQDLELVEGKLKITSSAGLGLPETATISNAQGILKLDPASGHSVIVDAPHDLQIADGTLYVKGDARVELEDSSGDIMALQVDGTKGGMTILRNSATVGYYFDDDNDYLSIGIPIIDVAPGYTHLEINQMTGKKAITMNNHFGEYWDLSVDSDGDLKLYYGSLLKGVFSKTDGTYSNVIIIPPSPLTKSKEVMDSGHEDLFSDKGGKDVDQIVENRITLEGLMGHIRSLEYEIELLKSIHNKQ